MRVYMTADMEGASGIVRTSEVLEGQFDYEACRELMLSDVNAAIAGAFEGGAEEVWVNDAHWSMTNLPVDRLDPRAQLVRGATKRALMTEGLNSSFDVYFMIGLHAMVGRSPGVMNETIWGREIHGIRLNGQDIGEIGLCAYHAGSLGVPVGLVTGDDMACEEGRALVGESCELVAVKFAIERYAARCLSPSVTRTMIHEAAERSVQKCARLTPLAVPEPVTIEIVWTSTAEASVCSMIPTVDVDKNDFRVNRIQAGSFAECYTTLLAALLLGRTASDETYG